MSIDYVTPTVNGQPIAGKAIQLHQQQQYGGSFYRQLPVPTSIVFNSSTTMDNTFHNDTGITCKAYANGATGVHDAFWALQAGASAANYQYGANYFYGKGGGNYDFSGGTGTNYFDGGTGLGTHDFWGGSGRNTFVEHFHKSGGTWALPVYTDANEQIFNSHSGDVVIKEGIPASAVAPWGTLSGGLAINAG
jgi:hypothetical protein